MFAVVRLQSLFRGRLHRRKPQGHMLPKAVALEIASHDHVSPEEFELRWTEIAGRGATSIAEGVLYKAMADVEQSLDQQGCAICITYDGINYATHGIVR